MDLTGYLKERRDLVNRALDRLLPGEKEYPEILHKAMRYSVFAGGKRVRPILALAACESVGGAKEDALFPGCALEMIHTYSLIHDDLPAMDNDDLRRGVATNHKVFGEAVAILAGDSLLTHAFRILSDQETASRGKGNPLLLIREMTLAAGNRGMIGGQVVDLLSEGEKEIDAPLLDYIHTHKTGALLRASVRMGGIAGGAGDREMKALTRYGDRIGLAFQIVDDLLDLEGDEKIMGKRVGSDLERGKKTYPRLFGIPESKRRASNLVEEAVDALGDFGPRAEPLRAIASFILNRIQ